MNLKITPAKAKRTYHIIIRQDNPINRRKPLLFNEVMNVIDKRNMPATFNIGTGRIELSSASKQILDELKKLNISYGYKK